MPAEDDKDDEEDDVDDALRVFFSPTDKIAPPMHVPSTSDIHLVASVVCDTASRVEVLNGPTKKVHTAVRRGRSFQEVRVTLPLWPHKPAEDNGPPELWTLSVVVLTSLLRTVDRKAAEVATGRASGTVKLKRYGPPLRAAGRLRLACVLLALDKDHLVKAVFLRRLPRASRAADAMTRTPPAALEEAAAQLAPKGPETVPLAAGSVVASEVPAAALNTARSAAAAAIVAAPFAADPSDEALPDEGFPFMATKSVANAVEEEDEGAVTAAGSVARPSMSSADEADIGSGGSDAVSPETALAKGGDAKSEAAGDTPRSDQPEASLTRFTSAQGRPERTAAAAPPTPSQENVRRAGARPSRALPP